MGMPGERIKVPKHRVRSEISHYNCSRNWLHALKERKLGFPNSPKFFHSGGEKKEPSYSSLAGRCLHPGKSDPNVFLQLKVVM